jgi:hypothetical protein
MLVDMSHMMHSFDTLRSARHEGRRLTAAGVLWLVYEIAPFTYDHCATSSLVFEDDASVRRVQSFPAGWRSLNDDALFALTGANAVPNASN